MLNHYHKKNREINSYWIYLPLLVFMLFAKPVIAQTSVRYEAETCNLANATISSTGSGYSGTGYVTNLTSEWTKVSFDKGFDNTTLVKVDIRYSNPTGAISNNLALYLGSEKVKDLSFPTTASSSDWATLSVTFSVNGGYQTVSIKGQSNVSSSVNLDYLGLTIGVAPPPPPAPGTFSLVSPAASSTGVSTLPVFSWNGSIDVSSYTLLVSTSNTFSSPVINQSGLTSTSYTATSALSASTLYYWKVSAINSSGTTSASNAGISFTTAAPVPAPGSFTQTSPANAATSVLQVPSFSWAASSNASTYTLVVSTSSSFTNPVINQSGISGTSYTSGVSLSNSTQYYWKVTASNSTGSTTATNSGISFTTAAAPPVTANGDGKVTREYWAGISGTAVSDLTGNANFPNSPTSTSFLTSLDAPHDVADNYGQRIKGYIKAPATGSYKFWLASDDNSELWLSTNESTAKKVKIASVTGWTNYLQFDKFGTQAATVNLIAGNWYYIEILQKENDGGDNATVAWQIPGGSQVIVPGSVLSSVLPTPIPLPGTFTQTSPANAATGVLENGSFTWASSTNADFYSLVVSTNSDYSSPVINTSGLTATTYTPSILLAGTTKYYWKVTATNVTGSTSATNAGISFTTRTPPPPPAPGAFSQTTPASSETGVSQNPSFTWGTSSNASGYTLIVSASSSYTNPVINVSGLTSASYSPSTSLADNTTYYWKVTAVNSGGSTTSTNAGISFITAVAPVAGATFYVSPSGIDAAGRGSSTLPYKTLAYAATQVPAGLNNTIYLNAGTYIETTSTLLPVGVNILGAGESSVTITASGALPTPGVDPTDSNFKLWADGSLIQLVSPIYSGSDPRYGPPSEMIAASNGNQTISGFTIDGHSKQVKAGVWVLNRNNVTLHHVTFKNLDQRGAVFTRGDMWWYIPIPEGKWMKNSTIYNCTFINSGKQISGEGLGNLCLGGLDGANIYNITINESEGYGIKFIHVGHYRNLKIHDCDINVSETDPAWGEAISIELWNLSYDNEIYNINCNTWFSMVNSANFSDYQPSTSHPSNLKIRNVKMIGLSGTSSKESIESALSGVEISESYFQDKGFGIAIWGGSAWGPAPANHNIYIHNNIFTNVVRTPGFAFGQSSAVFVPDPGNNIQIYNNVFDNLGNALTLTSATTVDIKNNVFLNTQGNDVDGGSGVTFTNNLKYQADLNKANFALNGPTLGAGNILGLPGFKNAGNRFDTYYQPSSASSLVADKGANVGIPYNGSPDIGRWEFGLTSFRTSFETKKSSESSLSKQEDAGFSEVSVYPVPSNDGIFFIANPQKFNSVEVYNLLGVQVLRKSVEPTHKTSINISDQKGDVYIIKIKGDTGMTMKRVVYIK